MNQQHGQRVSVGATVELRDAATDATSTYRIVAARDADVAAGRLSVESPVARAVLGAQVGDSVRVDAPAGVRTYTVEAVETDEG